MRHYAIGIEIQRRSAQLKENCASRTCRCEAISDRGTFRLLFYSEQVLFACFPLISRASNACCRAIGFSILFASACRSILFQVLPFCFFFSAPFRSLRLTSFDENVLVTANTVHTHSANFFDYMCVSVLPKIEFGSFDRSVLNSFFVSLSVGYPHYSLAGRLKGEIDELNSPFAPHPHPLQLPQQSTSVAESECLSPLIVVGRK